MDRFDPRWADDRDRSPSADRDWGGRSGRGSDEPRDRHVRSPFTRDLDLPGGDERVRVRAGGRDYDLDGADTEPLATIGAFRVVQVEDLRDALEATRYDNQRLEALQAAVARLEDGNTFNASPDEVSRFFQDRPGEPHGEGAGGAAKKAGNYSGGRT